jgi:hypothetical protein
VELDCARGRGRIPSVVGEPTGSSLEGIFCSAGLKEMGQVVHRYRLRIAGSIPAPAFHSAPSLDVLAIWHSNFGESKN